jgi:O-Antigen ligase
MPHENVALAAAVLGAAGALLFLLGRNRRPLLVGLVAIGAAEIGLGFALVPNAAGLISHSAVRLGMLALAALVVFAAASAFIRWPFAVPIALLVTAPFRQSVHLGSQQAFLLVPLYAALAAATLAFAYRTLRDREPTRIPHLISAPAAGLVALSGLSLLWAHDVRAAATALLFFYFPFTVLLGVVARSVPWSGTWRALAVATLAVTGFLSAIGVYQAWSHVEILAKQDVQLTNAYSSFFRVTSLFQDPTVYGRHVVLGIVVLLVLLWYERLRPAFGLPLLGLFAAGLYFSYSQTSQIALFAAVLVICVIAGDWLTRKVVVGTASALAVSAAVIVLVVSGGESARQVTSDRIPLARTTWPVYTSHPLIGVGIGSQPLVSRQEADAHRRKSKNVSHTTPLTVAAELGTLGLIAYVALLAGLGKALLITWHRHRALTLTLTASITAFVVQSLFYGGFFEDPFVWGIAALTAMALVHLPAVAPEPRSEAGTPARQAALRAPTPVPRKPQA